MKTIFSLSLFAALVLLSNCATLFKNSAPPEVSLSSNPDNAKVYVNGVYMGSTPLKLSLVADKTYDVRFEKNGFPPIHRQIGKTIGAKWIILDVVGGGVPLIVDAITGKWYDLDQEQVEVKF